MEFLKRLLWVTILFFSIQSMARAACTISRSDGQPLTGNQDLLVQTFSALSNCTKDVFEFRSLLVDRGFNLQSTFIGNRGFHNPGQGSFSLFEMASGNSVAAGEFFFGHFTAPNDNDELALDQDPRARALMIELIAWDSGKGNFNFYELIGDGTQGKWFYRGDSSDIFRDNQFLHLQPNPARPKFGKTLRCSGCHLAGGPILKELALPHNDWWDPSRKLPLGARKPDRSLQQILEKLVPAEELAKAVRAGVSNLENSPKHQEFKRGLSFQELMRPLFCPLELNLESDSIPLDNGVEKIQIPSGFFLDPRLATAKVEAPSNLYKVALSKLRSQFPEIQRNDADHAWLTPVKAYSDQIAVDQLVKQEIVNEQFVISALSVDFSHPVYSKKRCSLLKFLPEKRSPGWLEEFRARLKSDSSDAAQEMLQNLSQSVESQKARAQAFLGKCQVRSTDELTPLVRFLSQLRVDVRTWEISKNPLGQILEPGFRVIFPETSPRPTPGRLYLNNECKVSED